MLLEQIFDALEMNNSTFMSVEKFFWNFSEQIWQEMKHKGNFKQWFNVFLLISEASKGYESKA